MRENYAPSVPFSSLCILEMHVIVEIRAMHAVMSDGRKSLSLAKIEDKAMFSHLEIQEKGF